MSLLDRLTESIFAPPASSLPPEMAQQAGRQARLQAGLALLSQSGPSLYQQSPLPAIAAAIQYGQQAYAGTVQQARGEEVHEQLQKAIANGAVSREELTPILLSLISAGDPASIRSASALSELLKSMDDRIQIVRTPSRTLLIDQSGQVIREFEGGGPRQLSTTMEKGKLVRALVDTTTGDVEVLRDRDGNAVPAPEPLGLMNQEFTREAQLSTAFSNERLVKDANVISGMYGTVLASAEDPSAAGDLSLIFAYMKMLDPGSVVREGEFATAQNAPGVPDRVRAQYNRLLKGERFTQDVRDDFVDRAGRLIKARQKGLLPIIKRYEDKAKRFGIGANVVTYDPFAGYGGTTGTLLDDF